MAVDREEFRGLIEDACDALDRLFDRSAPDAWMLLRRGYGEMSSVLRLDDKADELRKTEERLEEARRAKVAEEERRRHEQEAWRQQRGAWTMLASQAKTARILNALGDEALIRREILKRLETAHPEMIVYEGDLARPLATLLATGEVEREKEPRSRNCTVTEKSGFRWRWRRTTTVSPELQDLERRLKEA